MPGGAVAGEHRQRLGHDRALDAAAADAADHLAVARHGHRRARLARPGALDVDDTGDGDPLAGAAPSVEIVQQILHAIQSAGRQPVLAQFRSCGRGRPSRGRGGRA